MSAGAQADAGNAAAVTPAPEVTVVEAPPLTAGGPATLITVRGHDFRSESIVQIAGSAVPTRYLSSHELIAAISPESLAQPGQLSINVMTPGPGGGISNSVNLAVRASFPGRFLVFTSNRRGGRNHIYLLDRQDEHLDHLDEANSVNGNDAYPSISADGRFIVFQSDRNRGQNDVFLFDRETRMLDALPELNDPTAFDGFPHISPDARFIAFESDRFNNRPKVFLFDLHSRTLQELKRANEATADDGLAAISN
jgi:dipeptidyl aminopeptidase/acylaminoacyl peptidase